MRHILAALMALLIALPGLPAAAQDGRGVFTSIDGGTLDLADWHGRPVLVVNTASRCAFTPQYDALQALYDRYRDRGLVVLAVPSNDFRQELATAEEVAEFCQVNFGLDMPMTDITRVTGDAAHPFYRWLAGTHGIAPAWNFNKVLLDGTGTPVAVYGSAARPLAPAITRRIEALLTAGS